MVTRNLLRDESGATAVVIGLSMTALMGFAGMGVDIGVWYSDKRAAQAAADSAAYSAAVDYGASDTTAGAETAARAVAAQDGYTSGSGGVTVAVSSPPTTGTHTTTATGAMEVIVTKTESLFFSEPVPEVGVLCRPGPWPSPDQAAPTACWRWIPAPAQPSLRRTLAKVALQ